MSNTPKIRFDGFTDAWEQRKVGDVLSESQTQVIQETSLRS